MIKKILLVLAGIVILFLLIGLALPSTVEVSKSTTIQAPASYAYEEVNNLENWSKWSYWNSSDTTMIINYGDVRSGEGASYTWSSPEMGDGKMTITESIEDSIVRTDFDFMEMGTAKGWYTFSHEDDGTIVTMSFTTEFGMNPVARWMGVMMRGEIEKAFDFSLDRLKEIAEGKPTFNMDIGEVALSPIRYIGLSATMDPRDDADVSLRMGMLYSRLATILQRSGVEPDGPPFSLYPAFTETSMDVICAMPLAYNVTLPAQYPIDSLSGGRAIKGTHYGAYEGLTESHSEIARYVEYKGLSLAGPPMEVYITDPGMEPDTTKWITEIYYPVAN